MSERKAKALAFAIALAIAALPASAQTTLLQMPTPVPTVKPKPTPTPKPTTWTPGQIQGLIDNTLNGYLAAGKFVGPPGPQGPAGAISTYPANPSSNSNGGSIAGFSQLSASNLTVDQTTTTKALNVSGNGAIIGGLTVGSLSTAGTISAASFLQNGTPLTAGASPVGSPCAVQLYASSSTFGGDANKFCFDPTIQQLKIFGAGPDSPSVVIGDSTSTHDGHVVQVKLTRDSTAGGGLDLYSAMHLQYLDTAASGGYVDGLEVEANSSANAGEQTQATGAFINAHHDGSGIEDLLVGLSLGNDLASSGAATENDALQISAQDMNGGTTNYGIHIGDQTGAATNYAIKTGLGEVDFGDTVNATAYTVGGTAGLSVVKTVKGSTGSNCTMTFTSGLLTATTCP